jgi:hypothetical protein
LPAANDLAGVDQPRDDLAGNAEAKVALHACADGAGELAGRSLNLAGGGDPHQRRIGARVGGGSPASGQ